MARLRASYVVSFVTIGVIWISHHFHFVRVESVDRPMLYLNLLLLMIVAFLPFPTAVLADHVNADTDAEVAVVFYALTLAVGTGVFTLLSYYGSSHGLERNDTESRAARTFIVQGVAMTGAYVLVVPVALINPIAGLVACGLLTTMWIVPTRSTLRARREMEAANRAAANSD